MTDSNSNRAPDSTGSATILHVDFDATNASGMNGEGNGREALTGSASISSLRRNLRVMKAVTSKKRRQEAKPLLGKHVVLLLHARPTAVAFVKMLKAAGADLTKVTFFFKDYEYPEKEPVLRKLGKMGCRLFPIAHVETGLGELKAVIGNDPLLLVEDGGKVGPHIYNDPILRERLIGGVEQTTRGDWSMVEQVPDPHRPHLMLPRSVLKKTVEPHHVANAVVTAVQRLAGEDRPLSDMNVAVIGIGAIGGKVADRLVSVARSVTVFDCDPPRYACLADHGAYTFAGSVRDAVKDADLVIGATGKCILDVGDLVKLKDGVLLASASSETHEYPVEFLANYGQVIGEHRPPGASQSNGTWYRFGANGPKICLLADARPANLSHVMAEEGEPTIFDLIMALIGVAAIELAAGAYADQRGYLDVFDEIAERHQLPEIYAVLHGEACA